MSKLARGESKLDGAENEGADGAEPRGEVVAAPRRHLGQRPPGAELAQHLARVAAVADAADGESAEKLRAGYGL